MLQSDIPSRPSDIRWRGVQAGNRLDCETGVLLRATLEPVFRESNSWQELRGHLRDKGFDLGFHDGRLVLTDMHSGERICSCKFLGHPLANLTARLGKVRVKAPGKQGHSGQLLA